MSHSGSVGLIHMGDFSLFKDVLLPGLTPLPLQVAFADSGSGELDKTEIVSDNDKVTERTGYWQKEVGEWVSPDGSENEGLGLEGGVRKLTGEHVGRFFDMSWDAGAGTANANFNKSEAPNGDSSTNMGVGANLIEGSGTITSKDKEDSLRVGGSIGEGGALRNYYTDLDGDGDEDKYGIGVDAGPLSFDIKSKTAAKLLHSIDIPDVIGDSVATNPLDVLNDLW